LEDDNFIFKQPYRLNEMKRALVQVQTTELLDVGLAKLSKGDFVLAIVMSAIMIFLAIGWNSACVGIITQSTNAHVRTSMSCLYQKKIFDAFSHAKVFNTLELRSGYDELPLKKGDKVKTTFWGINLQRKDFFIPMAIFAI
jgi:hypothetical protein